MGWFALGACSVPSSVQDATNKALSSSQCSAAIEQVESTYNSSSTNNTVRLLAASAYACSAGVNLFDIFDDLLAFPQSLGGPAFWEFLVQEFPSTSSPDDRKPQAAKNGMDALMSVLKTGIVTLPAYMINSTSNNPGSLLTADRLDDANSYMGFVSMSLMGTLLYRYGSPLPNNHKSTSLPWTTAALTTGDGCAVAAALLNFKDSIEFIKSVSSSSVASLFTSIDSYLTTGLDAACNSGCLTGGCTMGCSTCPTTLRNRSACTGATTDVNSCAAKGLIAFINASWTGPP